MNRLFCAYKPPFITSNSFLQHLKRKYNAKKAGFSGTLDPFACGVLIIAFGSYTKLFRFLKKYPKVYRATLWLGAKSRTLDIEGVEEIKEILPKKKVKEVVESFKGKFTYTPPLFSAKKIEGKRAYQFAYNGDEVELKEVTSYIYSITLLNYSHPFVTFEAVVSEGTYIRSLGEMIARKLNSVGTLTYLERVKEGEFSFNDEKPLNPLNYLISKENFTTLRAKEILQGKRIPLDSLKFKEEGLYHLVFNTFFTIVEVKNKKVFYKLNNIPKVKD